MRRPFKLFFALSLGIILFLFFAKIVLIALVMALVMSVVFGLFRKAKRFIQPLWREEEDYWPTDLEASNNPFTWKENLLEERPVRGVVYLDNHRSIIVR